jgi:hypothetical protein
VRLSLKAFGIRQFVRKMGSEKWTSRDPKDSKIINHTRQALHEPRGIYLSAPIFLTTYFAVLTMSFVRKLGAKNGAQLNPGACRSCLARRN